ncbi:MAG: hypothetical protein ACE149_18595 [Armatimonadota bacterium]
MSRTKSSSRLCLSIALLLLAAALAAGAESAAPTTPQPPQQQSKIWGWWPLLPWDRQATVASPLADSLNAPFDLSRKGKVGEQRRYQIRRTNLTVGRTGAPASRMVAEAQLLRTLVREVEPGLWVEQCEWERFAAAQAMTPDDYPAPQELPSARGISFEFSPRAFDYVNAPADFARVGDEMAGYLLKVLTMDAMGWDAILLTLRDQFGKEIRIGDTWRETKWEPWDISRVGGEGLIGQYQAGEMQVSVAGITRRQGQPCLLIWFSMEGNKVTQRVDNPMFAMEMEATEYFRGEMTVSLLDGHVVGMELTGPLPCVLKMGFGGQPATEQPIGAIIQQVSMWEIPVAGEKAPAG